MVTVVHLTKTINLLKLARHKRTEMVTKMPSPIDEDNREQAEKIRDTIPNTELEFLLEQDGDICEEQSSVHLKAGSLLRQSAEWYSTAGEVKIIDIQQERLAMRYGVFMILKDEYLRPAFKHIAAKTPEYPDALATQYKNTAIYYLQKLHAEKYMQYFPIDLLLDLQTIILNGDWLTGKGIKEMRETLRNMLIVPKK